MLAFPLGPFDLLHPAGRGAMAEVWRAVHRTEGVPAAVKVVTAPIALAAAEAAVAAAAAAAATTSAAH